MQALQDIPLTIDTSNKKSRLILWTLLIFWMGVLTRYIIFKRSPEYIKKRLNEILHHYSWKLLKANMDDGNFNIIPFASIKFYMETTMPFKYVILNLVGNVAGFIPLGILFPLMFIRLRSAAATIFAVFLVSFCFEIIQLFTMIGVCDIDDIILNTSGGIIGYFIFRFMKKNFSI